MDPVASVEYPPVCLHMYVCITVCMYALALYCNEIMMEIKCIEWWPWFIRGQQAAVPCQIPSTKLRWAPLSLYHPFLADILAKLAPTISILTLITINYKVLSHASEVENQMCVGVEWAEHVYISMGFVAVNWHEDDGASPSQHLHCSMTHDQYCQVMAAAA